MAGKHPTSPLACLDGLGPNLATPPPLEAEPLHRRLARLEREHKRVTEELRELREDWKNKNLRAQATRTPIPTSEITFVEKKRRELHLELERIQASIGETNRRLREDKAERALAKARPKAEPKKMPFKDDPEFPTYFLLAARDSLTPALFDQVERTAKALMADARKMGVEP